MKNADIRHIHFTDHFIDRFVLRFGKRYSLSAKNSRTQKVMCLLKILSEAADVLPTDSNYGFYCRQRYGEERMVKGRGVVFFIRDNVITTCIESDGKFGKPVNSKMISDKPFSLGDCLTDSKVFDRISA